MNSSRNSISRWIKRIHVTSAQWPRPTFFSLGPAWQQLILQSISLIYSTHKTIIFVTTAHFGDLGQITSAHFLYIVAFSDSILAGLIYGIIWYNIVNKLHVYTNYYTNIFSYIFRYFVLKSVPTYWFSSILLINITFLTYTFSGN